MKHETAFLAAISTSMHNGDDGDMGRAEISARERERERERERGGGEHIKPTSSGVQLHNMALVYVG